MKIKPDDYVLVESFGDEAFLVLGISKGIVSLAMEKSGLLQPISVCTRIPKKLHKYLHVVTETYLLRKGRVKMPV